MTDNEVKDMPRTYKIRSDGSILIPDFMLTMLGWKPDDQVRYSVTSGTIVVSRVEPTAEKEPN